MKIIAKPPNYDIGQFALLGGISLLKQSAEKSNAACGDVNLYLFYKI